MCAHSKPYITAIIPAAGSGVRLGSKISKPLVEIGGKPILIHAVKAISKSPYVRDIIVVANQPNIALIKSALKRYRVGKVRDIVLGGATRRQSVENGLKAVSYLAEYVLIHDGVRPFIEEAVVRRTIEAALKLGAAITGMPVKATVKRARSYRLPITHENITVVRETVPRDNLWEIQTPQVFKKDILLRAHERGRRSNVTDDAALVEKLGVKVQIVRGSYCNIKITTLEDLLIAQAIRRAQGGR